MSNTNEKVFLAGLAVIAVVAWITLLVGGICYTICEDMANAELREQLHHNRDTIYQLRLQVIELESELEIENHWEE